MRGRDISGLVLLCREVVIDKVREAVFTVLALYPSEPLQGGGEHIGMSPELPSCSRERDGETDNLDFHLPSLLPNTPSLACGRVPLLRPSLSGCGLGVGFGVVNFAARGGIVFARRACRGGYASPQEVALLSFFSLCGIGGTEAILRLRATEWPLNRMLLLRASRRGGRALFSGAGSLWRRRASSGGSSSAFDAEFLRKREANYAALSPTSLLLHVAKGFPNRMAYVSGAGVVAEQDEVKRTWGEVYQRVLNSAHALRNRFHVQPNEVVSVIAPNSHPIFELHFSVPAIRGVLHCINTRLDAATICFQLQHAETKVFFVDSEFASLAHAALALLPPTFPKPVVIDIVDSTYLPPSTPTPPPPIARAAASAADYEDLTQAPAPATFAVQPPADEWDAIALNYTSGTTGSPKGVVSHHRGAYLNAIQNIVESGLQKYCRYLWIVPLFHCNGWSFVWSLAANAGTSYFLRAVRPGPMLHILSKHKINLFSGAPITMLTLLSHVEALQKSAAASPGSVQSALGIPYMHPVKFTTAGAPPPPPLIEAFRRAFGMPVQTLYGLTESYGPISSHQPDEAWGDLSPQDLLARSTWQSKGTMLEEISVVDPETLLPVPADGSTKGEIVLRGNIIMKGYLKNKTATDTEFRGGYFFTGDVAVMHAGNRVEIKDRSKDVIISGGENVSSVDVETTLLTHPDIAEAAVVAMPDAKWGEVPCAFVVLKPHSAAPPPADLVVWARARLAGFMAPKAFVVLAELPKTGTGKVLKHALRTRLPSK